MCGIVAYKGRQSCLPFLFEGLKKLEYRGYDSSGISYIYNNRIFVVKQPGCIDNLRNKINLSNISPHIGIGHTRWATHGKPCKRNAHPHITRDSRLCMVHNGIIENYSTLKEELLEKEYKIISDTDSEVFLYLVYDYLVKEAENLFEATKLACERIVGAYAAVFMDNNDPFKLILAKRGSPIVLAKDGNDFFIASDAMAISNYAKEEICIEDDSVCEIHKDIECYNMKRSEVSLCNIRRLHYQYFNIEKGKFPDFMLKEIYEQPKCIEDCISGRIEGYNVKLGGLIGKEEVFRQSKHITILGCGTSWHSAILGKYFIEELTDIKVSVEHASEFKYRQPNICNKDIVIGLSQSGETADTIEGLKTAKELGASIMGICNVVDSSIPRMTDFGIYTRAGMEIGVASTKAFTNQVISLLLLALWIEHVRGGKKIIPEYRCLIIEEIKNISQKVSKSLKLSTKIKKLASKFKKNRNCLYLGRQYNYPIALEGALKLKEISYVHAEGYPASEMKHGPIALIDKNMPVIVMANNKKQYDKVISNIQEIKSREGVVIALSNSNIEYVDFSIIVPETIDLLSCIISVVPLQLFAYYSAVIRGCNVDKPRNLAKSVTVE